MRITKFAIVLIALAIATTCLAAEAGVAASAASGITPGRTKSLVAAAAGVISVVIGGLALARSSNHRTGTGNGRTGAVVALVFGLTGMLLSVVHLGSSTGGFGTGSGRAGAIVALVLGLVGMNLGGLALARSRVPSSPRPE